MTKSLIYNIKPGIMSVDSTVLKTITFYENYPPRIWLDGFQYSFYINLFDFIRYKWEYNNFLY